MATRYFTDADIDEMVFLAKKYGSYRRAAKEFGCSYQAVIDHCHERGFHIAGPHERCKSKKHKIVNGYVFYWCKKGYYRGNVGKERLILSDYCYRLKYGQKKPYGLNICFIDGDRENYDLDNLEYVTVSEFMKRRNSDPAILAMNRKILEDGRNKNIAMEKKKPWLAKRRGQRTWRTRRINDPDNISAMKGAQTRRRNAEERGFFYTPEQIEHLSAAHKGITKAIRLQRKREAEKAAIRAKLGMNF